MKMVKSLLLGSAAGLVAITGAQAADLPLAEPVEYVRICDTWGNGYYYIPGTNTCLQIGGWVRAQLTYNEQHHSYNRSDTLTLGTVAGVGAAGGAADGEIVAVGGFQLPGQSNSLGRTRNPLGFGQAAAGRVWFDARTQTEYGTLRSYLRLSGNTGAAPAIHQAFIQFAGLTAGRALSGFDFTEYTTYTTFGSETQIEQFTYTATFGGGFSASIGIEDRNERQTGFLGGAYGGQSMPDVVASLGVTQAWGSAKLSGAIHQLRDAGAGLNPSVFADTEYGFAIQGGVRVNLPMLAAGDYLYVSATYADGAVAYLGGTAGAWNVLNGLNLYDAVVYTDVNGNRDFKNTKGWNVHGGIRHFWAPNLRSNLNVGYAHINQFGTTQDYKQWTVAGNIIYSPVRNLDFGLEVFYQNLSAKNGAREDFGFQRIDTKDAFGAIFRVQRNF